LASTANAQRVFRASSIDIEQNERIDAIDQRVERIESSVASLVSAIEKQIEVKPVTVEAAPPKVETVVSVRKPSAKPASNYYSQAELIGIVRAAYPNGNYTRYADVSPRSGVWRHLQDSNHRFTASQVEGLPQDIALGLHGLHHANLIRATRGTSKVSAPVVRSQPAKVVQAAGGCPNGQCARQSQPARQQQFRTFRLFR
jgi:hypothetical protein